jgi:hypothetical protein
VSRKHHRGRRGHAFKNHFPAQQDDKNDSSHASEDSSKSQSESHDD